MSRLRVAFDLDDTLYPERQFALCGFRACGEWAKAQFGVDGLAEEMTRLLDTGMLGKLFKMVLESHVPDHRPEHLVALREAYRGAAAELSLFDDAHWALEHYAAKGPLGLITDGTHTVQRKKVTALALEPRFHEIVYTDALGEDRAYFKPHPMAFERVAAAIGVPGDRFVYVGDNPVKDFVAPNAMGWTTVQVVRDGGIHDVTKVIDGGAPQHRISSLSELPDILGI
ncbi:MAG TPA: HAD family hydrolase [Hyphomicrobiaceae bacterium]|nr:HAD family hydrolase [Hyphomicrobiaceae bacterium]